MPQLELSLSGPTATALVDRAGAVARWAGPAAIAEEPCLVLDASGAVAAASPSCRALLGLCETADVDGLGLLDGVLALVDFTAAQGRLADWELERIPPLLALTTGGLARGLLRYRLGDAIHTVDAVTTPLWDGADVVGSLTFFCRV